MMAEPDFLFQFNMENLKSIFEGEEQEVLVKGVQTFNTKSETYLSPVIKKTRATEDIPQALKIETVRNDDKEKSECEVFRRSSLLMHSPLRAREEAVVPDIRITSLPNLQPLGNLEKIDLPRPQRASTPLGGVQPMEETSVVAIDDTTIIQDKEEDEINLASSSVFVPSKRAGAKRIRDASSGTGTSDEYSSTGDEGSVVAGDKPKRRKRGRPRTTNVIEAIRAREAEREAERRQKREEWKRRMEDPNLVIPPATNLPSLYKVTEELENQPTPDLTSELMQMVGIIEKVAITSKNFKGGYASGSGAFGHCTIGHVANGHVVIGHKTLHTVQ